MNSQKKEIVKSEKSASIACKFKTILGEGPVWNVHNKTLLWVDIIGGKLYEFNPEKGENKELYSNCFVTFVLPTDKKGSLLISQERKILLLDKASGHTVKIAEVDEKENNRFNDAKCDKDGRVWMGTMDKSALDNAGALYTLDANYNISKKIPNTSIANGTIWSIDNKVLYFIDTATSTVASYDYCSKTNSISNKNIVIEFPEEIGYPDGMTISEDGKLWVALWGGNGVAVCDPVKKKIIEIIKVDAPHVTSCTFGGENLDELYITTAREGLSKEQLTKYPNSGSLFAYKSNNKGLKPNVFKIK